jgi:hypothetical protein
MKAKYYNIFFGVYIVFKLKYCMIYFFYFKIFVCNTYFKYLKILIIYLLSPFNSFDVDQ